MEPKQFDELTRTFANGISRRQALKMLISVVVGTVLPLPRIMKAFMHAQTASECPPPFPTNSPENMLPRTMTCTQVTDYTKNTGVTAFEVDWANCTLKSAPHPPSDGWTSYVFWNLPVQYSIKYTKNKRTGQWTASTSQKLRLSFTGRTQIYQITWDSVCVCDKTACKQEYDRWQRDITAHENHHVQDDTNIVTETKNNQICYRRVISYSGTSTTTGNDEIAKAEATAALNNAIQAAADAVIDCMNAEAEKRAAAFHNSSAGQLPGLNCDKCIPAQCPSGATLFSAGSVSALSEQHGYLPFVASGEATIVSAGSASLLPVSCGNICCDSSRCEVCDPATNACQPSCPECTVCNSTTGSCDPVDCGHPCLECVDNSCQPIKCGPCKTCQNGECVSACGACEICDNEGLCRACTQDELCCHGQCQPRNEACCDPPAVACGIYCYTAPDVCCGDFVCKTEAQCCGRGRPEGGGCCPTGLVCIDDSTGVCGLP